MRKLKVVILAALLVLLPLGGSRAAIFANDLIPARSVQPLVMAGQRICTTFSINEEERLWATAAHCVIPSLQFGMPLEIDRNWAVVMKVDPDNDLAVLQSPSKAPAIALAPSAPRAGDVVEVWGHPYGLPLVVRTRGVLAARSMPIPGAVISDILDLTVAGGNSGSPVLDTRGRVIGVIWGGFVESPHSLSVPWETVKRTIGSYWD